MSPAETWAASFEEGAILNIDKPAGMTSTHVVRTIKGMTGCKKVGHAGTLDPFATGVLLVCTESATKRVQELIEYEKEYIGEVVLGETTTTDDPEGEIIQARDVPQFEENRIVTALQDFHGEIQQVPPVYSALKVHGKRSYALARAGKSVPRISRTVHIYEIHLLEWTHPSIHIRIRCGRGTYIRSIARDVGEILETGGYLRSLKRVRIGPYTVENSFTLQSLRKMCKDKHERIPVSG